MRLRLRDTLLELKRGSPLIAGVLGGEGADLVRAAGRARELSEAGAAIVHAPCSPNLVKALAGEGVRVSVDVSGAEEARVALDAGAAVIARVGDAITGDSGAAAIGDAGAAASGDARDAGYAGATADREIAELCARTGACLALTVPEPAGRDAVAETRAALALRMALACELGVGRDQLLLDAGLGLGQPAERLRRLNHLASLGRPLLLDLSNPGFVSSLTGRAPAQGDAGVLAAAGAALETAPVLLRVRAVRALTDFLRVHAVLGGTAGPPGALPESLRREAVA